VITEAARAALDAAPWECYQFQDGFAAGRWRIDKFWRVRCAERLLETWWGRNGTNGQRKVKVYDQYRAARRALSDLAEGKIRKGYERDRDAERALASAAPSPPAVPRRPQIDPLTRRVAVYAQRDVMDGRRIVHPRGFKQMLSSAVAAEVVTGSQDYGYWPPDEPTPAPSVTAILDGQRVAVEVSNSPEGPWRAVSRENAAARYMRPHIMLPPAQSVPMDPGEEVLWWVSYGGSVVTGPERQVIAAAPCWTNTAQTERARAKLRELIARGGGRDLVMSLAGNSLGEMVVTQLGARPRPPEPEPAVPPTPKASIVALGRFTGLDDDEEI
jgi:predicted DNA-binding WGR domain protein